MHTRRQERLAIVALVGATAAWGSTFVVMKDAIARMPLMPFMVWRFWVAFALLAIMRPRILRVDHVTWRRALVIGFVSFLGYLFQTIGLQYTSASVSGFVTGMFVVITPLVGWMMYRERITGAVWIAVGIATIGLGLISLHGWSFGVGEAWTLAGAAMWSLQIIFFAKWSTRENAYALGALMIGVIAVCFTVGTAPLGFERPTGTSVWIAVFVTAVLATAFAFPAQSWGQSHLDATRAAVIFTMEPVFAMLFGIALGGDRLGAKTMLGAAMILGAMFVAEFGGRSAPSVESLPHPSL